MREGMDRFDDPIARRWCGVEVVGEIKLQKESGAKKSSEQRRRTGHLVPWQTFFMEAVFCMRTAGQMKNSRRWLESFESYGVIAGALLIHSFTCVE